MSSEDGSDFYISLSNKTESNSYQPFVKVGNNIRFWTLINILFLKKLFRLLFWIESTEKEKEKERKKIERNWNWNWN